MPPQTDNIFDGHWLYIGRGDATNTMHRVVWAENDGTVITWSLANANSKIGGYTWLGPLAEFLRVFKRTKL